MFKRRATLGGSLESHQVVRDPVGEPQTLSSREGLGPLMLVVTGWGTPILVQLEAASSREGLEGGQSLSSCTPGWETQILVHLEAA